MKNQVSNFIEIEGNEKVNQSCDFYNILTEDDIKEITEKVIGQKIVNVFAIQSTKDGVRIALKLSNNKRLIISQIEWHDNTFLKLFVLESNQIENNELKEIIAPLAHPVRATDS